MKFHRSIGPLYNTHRLSIPFQLTGQTGVSSGIFFTDMPKSGALLCLPCRPSGAVLEDVFRQLRGAFQSRDHTGSSQLAPYNVILTAEHMMVVPRLKETCGPVSVNSMGFAGSLFVRSQAELDYIKEQGPIRILSEVGLPWL